MSDFRQQPEWLESFAAIDDNDIITSIKVWQQCEDKILSTLCKMLLSRKLFKTEISKTPFSAEKLKKQAELIAAKLGISIEETAYFAISEKLINSAYDEKDKQIIILSKSGETQDIVKASDNLNILALTKPVEKFCFCYANVN